MLNPELEIERYQDITSSLEAVAESFEKVSRAKEEAYGSGYLDLLDEEIEKTKEENLLLSEQSRLAQENLKKDTAKLKDEYGLDIELDENGRIKNKEEIDRILLNRKNEAAQSKDSKINSLNEWVDNELNNNAYVTFETVPAGSTQEQKEAIEERNRQKEKGVDDFR